MSFEGNFPNPKDPDTKKPENEVSIASTMEPTELSEKLAKVKERNATDISSMKTQLSEYRTLAGWQPGEGFITTGISDKVNKQFMANQALKDRLSLLWTELQDAEEASNLQTQTENIRLLREDLTDFETEFVVEIEDAD